ncbi:MAG: cytochrome c oxidase subunit II [Haloferacaceae archaeon]
MIPITVVYGVPWSVAQTGIVPRGTRAFVFRRIFDVFLLLGTLVGIVVVSYMLYNAYKYRDREGRAEDDDVDRPTLGEIPQGGGKGRKLFTSFTLSAIIVISLIAWTYGALLFVESGPSQAQTVVQPQGTSDPLEVTVTGYQFGWKFEYPNGHVSNGVLRVPKDRAVRLTVTSDDVFHDFGVSGLKVKTDAIPGQTTQTWFLAEETGTYTARCYELCGAGHSYMTADVRVMEPDAYREWYAGTGGSGSGSSNSTASDLAPPRAASLARASN